MALWVAAPSAGSPKRLMPERLRPSILGICSGFVDGEERCGPLKHDVHRSVAVTVERLLERPREGAVRSGKGIAHVVAAPFGFECRLVAPGRRDEDQAVRSLHGVNVGRLIFHFGSRRIVCRPGQRRFRPAPGPRLSDPL